MQNFRGLLMLVVAMIGGGCESYSTAMERKKEEVRADLQATSKELAQLLSNVVALHFPIYVYGDLHHVKLLDELAKEPLPAEAPLPDQLPTVAETVDDGITPEEAADKLAAAHQRYTEVHLKLREASRQKLLFDTEVGLLRIDVEMGQTPPFRLVPVDDLPDEALLKGWEAEIVVLQTQLDTLTAAVDAAAEKVKAQFLIPHESEDADFTKEVRASVEHMRGELKSIHVILEVVRHQVQYLRMYRALRAK